MKTSNFYDSFLGLTEFVFFHNAISTIHYVLTALI